MIFFPVIILCTLGVNGPEGCVQYKDKVNVGYPSVEKCSDRVHEMKKEIDNYSVLTERLVKKPWTIKAMCNVYVTEDKV